VREWDFLCPDERDIGDLRGAVEAEGQAHGAEASVDVELHVAEVEEAFYVFLAHRWQDERSDYREADLAAMGVAGEHEVDEWEAGVLDYGVDEVGFVAHEDDRSVGQGGYGEIEVAVGGAGVAGAGEPEVVAAALDRDITVDQNRSAVCFEGVDDLLGADGDVVIAEDGVALWGLEGGEDFGTDSGHFEAEGESARAAADEVSGEEDELGLECVDAGDGLFEKGGLGVLLQVDVRELDHAEVLEGVGELGNGEGALEDLELVAGIEGGVCGQAETGGGASDEEAAAGDGVGI